MLLGGPRPNREHNIKSDVKRTLCEGVAYIDLNQGGAVMEFCVYGNDTVGSIKEFGMID